MKSRKIRSAIRSPLLALALVAIFAGTALATVASGFDSHLLSRGTISGPVKFNIGDIKFQTKADVDIATATVTIAPLGYSGWHSHPGVVLVTVKVGTVTFYDQNCQPTDHAAGTTFIEAAGDGPGQARNLSTTVSAIVYVTYIVPHGAPLRHDEPPPTC